MKVAILDIERVPGRFVADFWDLNGFKNRRISPSEVTEWPRTICFAWKWLDSKRVHFSAEWESAGYEGMLRQAHEVYDEADVVVGHNLNAFDTKHLRTGWRDLGLLPPAPFKIVDTLTQARRWFGDESMQLVALTSRLGIATKTDSYDIATARAAVAGDVKAQRKLKAYNIGDIHASEELYLRLRPWMNGHPHHALYALDDAACCQNCGSRDLQRRGYDTTSLGKYPKFQCKACGKWGRGKRNVAVVDVRGVNS